MRYADVGRQWSSSGRTLHDLQYGIEIQCINLIVCLSYASAIPQHQDEVRKLAPSWRLYRTQSFDAQP